MRLIVFFDLPVTTMAARRAANQFRLFLMKDGYYRLQLSVYARLVRGQDAIEKHKKRLCQNLPKAGFVRCMEVTEKQYAAMSILLGEKNFQEKHATTDQLLLF